MKSVRKPPCTQPYIATSTDTLSRIAAQFDTTVSELKKINRLMSDTIFSNQVIFVPDKDYAGYVMTSSTSSSAATTPLSPDDGHKLMEVEGGGGSGGIAVKKRHLSHDVSLSVGFSLSPPTHKVPGHIERRLSSDTWVSPPRALTQDEVKKLDEECHERFIKLQVTYITRNEDEVPGVFLITPDAVMFDPIETHPLVLQNGASEYSMVVPMESVSSVAVYHDVEDMKRKRIKTEDYTHAPSCPLASKQDGHSVVPVAVSPANSAMNRIAQNHSLKSSVKSLTSSNDSGTIKLIRNKTSDNDDKDDASLDQNLDYHKHDASTVNDRVSAISTSDDTAFGNDSSLTNSDKDTDIPDNRVSPTSEMTAMTVSDSAERLQGLALDEETNLVLSENAGLSAITEKISSFQETDEGFTDMVEDHFQDPGDQAESANNLGDSLHSPVRRDVPTFVSGFEVLESTGGIIDKHGEATFRGLNDATMIHTRSDVAANKKAVISPVRETANQHAALLVSHLSATKHWTTPDNFSADLTTSKKGADGHLSLDVAVSTLPSVYLCIGARLSVDSLKEFPVESYSKSPIRPEYWYAVPLDKVDPIYAFFVQWSPDIFDDPDKNVAAERGFVVIDSETGGALDTSKALEKEKLHRKMSKDWEIVNMKEFRRRLSQVELEKLPLPELSTKSKVFDSAHLRTLVQHLPARVEGSPWQLVYSSEKHGFSLKTLYRLMSRIDSPTIVIVKDNNGQIFGALLSNTIRPSEHFYGTGESYLFTFYPEFKKYTWAGINSFFVKGNADSLCIGASEGAYGLWFDGDLYHGRTQTCLTFENELLTVSQDFMIDTLETWCFI